MQAADLLQDYRARTAALERLVGRQAFEFHGPNQPWLGDITYVASPTGFVYLAVIFDAWSRRVVGYALDCTSDARLVTAALEAANGY